MNKGFEFQGLKVHSYDIFRVLLGLAFLGVDLYVYVKFYYAFEEKDTLGAILSIMLFVGIALLISGMDAWKLRDEAEKNIEEKRRKLELKKIEKESEELDKEYKPSIG